MGKYLDLANSNKAGVGSGANENYARELMQLFTIGLNMLNLDGSHVLDSHGNPIPTYLQPDIVHTAAALTGWTYPTAAGRTPQPNNWENFTAPVMETRQANHDTSAKTLINGCTLPAGPDRAAGHQRRARLRLQPSEHRAVRGHAADPRTW